MRSTHAAAIGTVIALLLGPVAGWAQQPTGDTFFIESIAASPSDATTLVPDPNEYQIDLRLPSGLTLSRSFQRSEVQMDALAFDTGIAETANTEATLTLGSRTSLSFTRTDRAVTDVLSSMIEQQSVTGLQFQQGFGSGSSTGMLTLSRAVQEDSNGDEGALRTLTQRAMLDTGLGGYGHLTASFTQRESEESASRLQETGYTADLRMALSGGEGQARYDFLERLVEGRSTQQRTIDLVAPFAVTGGTLSAEHHLKEQITDDHQSIDRKTAFTVPLDLVWDGATASFVEETKIRDDARDQKSVLSLAAPFSAFGHDALIEHIATETIRGTAWQSDSVFRLTAQFDGSPAIIERTETTTPSGEDVTHRTRLRFQSPQIRLADAMSLSANQMREEVEGDEVSRVSNIALTLKPFDPLDIQAGMTFQQQPGHEQLETRNLQTVLALAPGARLRGSISEREQEDGSPVVLRHVEVQRDRQDDLFDMRVGYTSYGDQIEQEDTALLAQVAVGADTGLGLNATYTEFDEKKMEPLAEPTTTVEVRAGDPGHVGMRAAFTEQATRTEPERTIGMAMTAFGGALRMDFIDNPLDPRGQTVMESDVYQIGFQREVFGGVQLDLGYRYFMPDGDADSEQFYKLRLDGGNVEDGGKITLSYLSGHYVPYPRSGDPPASLLDLTYEKRWPGDQGRLTLSLSREEAPSASVSVDDNIEGEVKYETRF